MLNTFVVLVSVQPTIWRTIFDHYFNRGKIKDHPALKSSLSYHLGLEVVRKFLSTISQHRVEEVQKFTTSALPTPSWISRKVLEIPEEFLNKAAASIKDALGEEDLQKQIGGEYWWQYRVENLVCEWVEAKSRLRRRRKAGIEGGRTLFYVHGGSYCMLSVDMERVQVQRWARKMDARAFAVHYRLSPQFPFPCGLQDTLAAYLYLLDSVDPEEIIIAGDSAGGGMIMSLLCTLRDSNMPLPSCAILLSPWVDLMHSFPSIAGDNTADYIPYQGFHFKPSEGWPPPLESDLFPDRKLETTDEKNGVDKPSASHLMTISINNKQVKLEEQVQTYTPNWLLDYPYISSVWQKTLSGLPPLLIIAGGGELLRDEITYLAHKAAFPERYPPPAHIANKYACYNRDVSQFSPTKVHFQIFDDACHVATTLGFSAIAKYMFRQGSNFALAHVKKSSVFCNAAELKDSESTLPVNGNYRVLNDHKTPSIDRMVRQRVSIKGYTREMEPESDFPCLNMAPEELGTLKPVPITNWLKKRQEWAHRYEKIYKKDTPLRAEKYKKALNENFSLISSVGLDSEKNIHESPPICAVVSLPTKKEAKNSVKQMLYARRKGNFAGRLWQKLTEKKPSRT